MLRSIIAQGSLQAEGLLPAPEGATNEQRANADVSLAHWRAVQPALSGLAAAAGPCSQSDSNLMNPERFEPYESGAIRTL